MNWLNLELTTLHSEQFLGSEPVERATWLCLMAYCADQENGGVMHCGEWGDRKLQQLIGVTSKEIRAPSELWSWTGNDLRVWGYPTDKEEEVKANRENGRKGGRPKKSASEKPKQNHPVIESENHMVNQVVPNRLNGKERKGIGKEEERNTIPRGRWNLKPLAVALQKRYNIGCPDMVGFSAAVDQAVADGFDSESVQIVLDWLGKRESFDKFFPSFKRPDLLREKLCDIAAKRQERIAELDALGD